MKASVVVATSAAVIAVLSLAVSLYEARATRRHDRISVRPFLELRVGLSQGRTAGLQLINADLGPAAITRTVLTLDGEPLGKYSESDSQHSPRQALGPSSCGHVPENHACGRLRPVPAEPRVFRPERAYKAERRPHPRSS